MTLMNHTLASVLVGLLLVGLGGCTESSEQSGSAAEDHVGPGSEVEAAAEKANSPRKNALAGDALDAVDLLITVNAMSSARGWNRNLDLSPELQARLSKYDGKVNYTFDTKGVNEPLLADGAKTIIPTGANFGGTLEGALNAEVKIVAGEVGVIKGEIFVSEGTKATVNGNHYAFAQGQWVETTADGI